MRHKQCVPLLAETVRRGARKWLRGKKLDVAHHESPAPDAEEAAPKLPGGCVPPAGRQSGHCTSRDAQDGNDVSAAAREWR